MSDDDAPRPPAARSVAASREIRDRVRRFIAKRVSDAATAEDLTQEVFLRMSQHAGELRDANAVTAWAYRIAHGVVVDHLRRQRPHVSFDESPAALAGSAVEPPAGLERELNTEVATWLRPMMALLPPEYAEALALTELEGLTQNQLAERLGISVSGAKSRVQRGRRLLEDVLRACCDFELDARGNVIGVEPRDPPGAVFPRKRPRG